MHQKIKKTLETACEQTIGDLRHQIQSWHNYLVYEKQVSLHTTYNYLLDINSFLKFLKEYKGALVNLETLSELSLSNFRAFLAARVKENNAAVSNKRALSSLKNLYRYLEKQMGLKNPHLAELKSPKIEKKLPKPIPLIQIQALNSLDALYTKQPKWVQMRDEALILLLYGCGLRISEALNLNVKDLNPGVIRVLGKRNKERILPLLSGVYQKIQNYLKMREDIPRAEGPLFIGAKGERLNPRTFQKAMEKIRLYFGLPETATPHSLRHSFASHLLAGGADLRSIQELLGHDSLASTQVYTKLEDSSLIETYMKAHPRARVGGSTVVTPDS